MPACSTLYLSAALDHRRQPLAGSRLHRRGFQLWRAVGDKADLLFGTHGQFTVSGALRLARQLEPFDPLWFEEPTPPEMPEEMALVARQTTIPIATGERLTTKYEFARVLEQASPRGQPLPPALQKRIRAIDDMLAVHRESLARLSVNTERQVAGLVPQAANPATYGDGRGAPTGRPGVARIYKSTS